MTARNSASSAVVQPVLPAAIRGAYVATNQIH